MGADGVKMRTQVVSCEETWNLKTKPSVPVLVVACRRIHSGGQTGPSDPFSNSKARLRGDTFAISLMAPWTA